MELRTLKTKLSFIKARGTRLILNNIQITRDSLNCTDLETYVSIKNNYGLNEGYQNIELLGLVPSVSNDDYPIYDFNIDNPRDHVTVKLDELFFCNKFASNDETRLCLNGVAFDSSHMVGTDGHVMRAYKTKTLSESYIVPRTSLKILEGLIKGFKIKGQVTISFDDSFATIHTEHFKFKARTIKCEFPRWQSIVPNEYAHTLKLSGLPKFKDIKPLLNKYDNAVAIECINGTIYLTISGSDLKFNLGTYESDFRLGFDMSYIELACNGLNTVELKFNSELAPALINEAIVMPLKL